MAPRLLKRSFLHSMILVVAVAVVVFWLVGCLHFTRRASALLRAGAGMELYKKLAYLRTLFNWSNAVPGNKSN